MLEQMQMRCPKLGGEITFAYCMKEGGEIPCARIVNCWQPYFPIDAYLRSKLTPQQWEGLLGAKPKEKMATLLELIEKAKAAQGGE